MNSADLRLTLSEFKDQKNIDRPTMAGILEDVFRAVLAKNHGSDDNYDVIINIDKGDFEIWRNREVVEDGAVEDANRQIGLSEAKKIQADYEVGEEVSDEVRFEDFARRNILAIRQNLTARISEYERDNLYKRYKDREGELVLAEVHQIRRREIVLLDDEGHELVMPKSEQIPTDFFRKGESISAVISSVAMGNTNPIITLSRTSPLFLERLMERSVPEIFDGLITIRKVVRVPGERAKVSVESYDDRIDPVGACVGMRGSRIRDVVRELRNENIDVINYTTNMRLYVARALSPATIASMELDEQEKHAEVMLHPDQVSLAIGKNGYNIRLASELTGYKIDVYRDTEPQEDDDIPLDEFRGDIDDWIIDMLHGIGLETALSVLDYGRELLIKRTDLEEETVDKVLEILGSEFEAEDSEGEESERPEA